MLRFALIAIGLIGPVFLIKYRERIGDTLGEADWMKKFGGVYMIVVIVAVIIFLWTIAEVTGTTDILFSPLKLFFPRQAPAPTF